MTVRELSEDILPTVQTLLADITAAKHSLEYLANKHNSNSSFTLVYVDPTPRLYIGSAVISQFGSGLGNPLLANSLSGQLYA